MTKRGASAILLLCACGCSVWYGERPECPLSGLKEVAVLPVAGAPQGQETRFGAILASELIQFPGITRAMRPTELASVLNGRTFDRRSLKDLRELAKDLRVNAVLVPELYAFDMHEPPRAEIRCALVMSSAGTQGPGYVLDLVSQGALPRHGTAAIPGVVWVEHVYDAESHATAQALTIYAWRNQDEATGLDRTARIERVGTNFFRFVSEQTIRELFDNLQKKADDDRSNECDRKLVYRQG
jgi:hypothetical protein